MRLIIRTIQLVTNLKLNLLCVHVLNDPKTRTYLNGILPINITSRSAAVKGDFVLYLKATFSTSYQIVDDNFKR
jgi:hypothetical protein